MKAGNLNAILLEQITNLRNSLSNSAFYFHIFLYSFYIHPHFANFLCSFHMYEKVQTLNLPVKTNTIIIWSYLLTEKTGSWNII